MQGVDEAVDLVAGHNDEQEHFSLQEARNIREKIDWVILPMLCTLFTCEFAGLTCACLLDVLYLRSHKLILLLPQCNSSTSESRVAQFIIMLQDHSAMTVLHRSTLGASAVLGIIQDNNLTADEFNTLGSAFYIGMQSRKLDNVTINTEMKQVTCSLPIPTLGHYNGFLWPSMWRSMSLCGR